MQDAERPGASDWPTRQALLERLGAESGWDLLIVGGGASGAGIALDAAARGYRVALVDRDDFGKGTSSRSTKLIHGGVRYLQQGNVSLVLEALRERGTLCSNAPHLVHDLAFVVPRYKWWEGPFYGVGLKMYDALARDRKIAPSVILDRDETLREIPNIEPDRPQAGAHRIEDELARGAAVPSDENEAVPLPAVAHVGAERRPVPCGYLWREPLAHDPSDARGGNDQRLRHPTCLPA